MADPVAIATPMVVHAFAPSAEAGGRLETRIVAAAELAAAVPAWRDLFHGCAQANPFYGPDFLLPLIGLDARLAKARFVLVSAGAQLVAFCPVETSGWHLPGLRCAMAMLRHPYIFDHLPLLRAGFERTGWLAVLDALERSCGKGVLAVGPSLLDGEPVKGLGEALAESGRHRLVTDRGERVVIAAAGAEASLAGIKSRNLSKLRKHERALAKLGGLDLQIATSGPELAVALDAFLELEARGWKGRQGSAFSSNPATAAFARELAASGGAPGLRIELLRLGGRAIGACLHLAATGQSATFKIAHDEELSRHAPGVLAMLRCLETLAAEGWTQCLDSGAAPEHAVGAVWSGRLPAGSMLLTLSRRQAEAELRLQARAAGLAERLRARLRDVYYRLTGRRRTQQRKPKDASA